MRRAAIALAFAATLASAPACDRVLGITPPQERPLESAPDAERDAQPAEDGPAGRDAGVADAAPGAPGLDITGTWLGRLPNQSVYLDCRQAGTLVSGMICERPGDDCMVLVDGKLAGDRFTATFFWHADEVTRNGALDLIVAADARTMHGVLSTDQCDGGCTFPTALTRQ